MKFEQYRIEPAIKRNLAELGFRRPTDIQYKAIPSILKGEDVLAIAQTGTGKTAAFAIPIVHLLHSQKASRRSEGIQCIVMAPTHELALQLAKVFDQLAQHTRVRTYAIIGGVEQDPQIQQLQQGIDVLIATPGRLFDLASQGHLDLSTATMLVLDEADHMLDLGFYKDIEDLIKHLPRKRQTLFFSATINKRIKKLAYSLVSNAIRIQISPKNPVAKNVEHALVKVKMDDKRFFLERLIKEHPGQKMLVFVRTKVRAERVSKALTRMDISSLTLHGDKDQTARSEALSAFREGKTAILIATDVSARGIDIPEVEFVINYDLPDKAENYVHRVGRTGRGNHKGQALSLFSPKEEPMREQIEAFIGEPIKELNLSKAEYQDTLQTTQDTTEDWRTVMKEIEAEESVRKGKRKKRRK
ncbi:MAG: DEAD/DEAH box helicase [Bacteroidota bacterium]